MKLSIVQREHHFSRMQLSISHGEHPISKMQLSIYQREHHFSHMQLSISHGEHPISGLQLNNSQSEHFISHRELPISRREPHVPNVELYISPFEEITHKMNLSTRFANLSTYKFNQSDKQPAHAELSALYAATKQQQRIPCVPKTKPSPIAQEEAKQLAWRQLALDGMAALKNISTPVRRGGLDHQLIR